MQQHIRNFAIIAHIDHGKSTLADRFLEITSTISGIHDDQLLDRNPISRERGITIKLAPVKMYYQGYLFNLIDTPGHVDFSYEVDRTLACVEGVLLLVDATQGIQAQTIANAYKALEKSLVIIPVINKIDLPNAQVQKTRTDLCAFLGCTEDEVHCVSAKTGIGVEALLHDVIERIPQPTILHTTHANQSLIFDSYYDTHKGVIAFVRVFQGVLQPRTQYHLCATKTDFISPEVGIFTPDLVATDSLQAGDIGYICTNLKSIRDVAVGDTVGSQALPGYRKVNPMVYAGVFTTDTADYPNFQKALEKLALNDSAVDYSPIYSQALGAGFRIGFLGLLHADVVRERLEREFGLSLILTPPQVDYHRVADGIYEEPIAKLLIVTPNEYVGAIMGLCEGYRGEFITMDNKHQVQLQYKMPLVEMISDFFDKLKSVSSGFASLDWELAEYRSVKADRLELLINSDPVEEFSEIVVHDRVYTKAMEICKKMRELIPRQQYEIKIQGRYKGKIIASERIAPYRKDVLIKNSKVVGAGDVGRKRKLLEKQKEGKKKMKMVGRVEIPKEAFQKLFHRNS